MNRPWGSGFKPWLWCLGLLCAFCPAVAPAQALAERLASHNHVLLMRHAYAPGVGDPPGYQLDRCETQRVLNTEGQRQAAATGAWLQTQGVSSALVYSSVWCRCQQTALLLGLGPVAVEPSLASFFDQPEQARERNQKLQAFIAQALRNKGKRALVLVTHHVNIREFAGPNIGSGDMVLARVDAQGRLLDHVVYRAPQAVR